MKRLIVFLAVVALAAVPLFAQDAAKKADLAGVWELSVESPQGAMTFTATYKVDGETLTGTHVSEMGETPLKGTVKGKEFSYTIVFDGGGQQMSILHKGTFDGDTLTGTAEVGEMGTMKFTGKRKK